MPSTNGHGPQRAILYARVSTDEQARSGYSLAQQMEALREYAAREGYEVLEEVTDPGQSGASLERPGMDRVRDLVAAGGVSAVLAQDRDRFAREPAYHYLIRKEFEEHGTKIRALNDRGDDSPEGELMDGVFDQFAKFERAKTAERTRRGKLRKAREGKVIAGRMAKYGRAKYGFIFNEERDGLVVDEEAMSVVRRIFYMIGVEGKVIYAVKRALDAEGVPTPTGRKQWAPSVIRDFVQDDLYKAHTFEEVEELVSPEVAAKLDPAERYGLWRYGRRRFTRTQLSEPGPNGRTYRKRQRWTFRPEEAWISVPVPDAGIPREWIEAARKAIKDNRRTSNAGRRLWELSGGILRCAQCGWTMYAHTTPPSPKKRYFYYVCKAKYKKGPDFCSASKSHGAEGLEARVWQEIRGYLKEPQQLRADLDRMIELERSGARGDSGREMELWANKVSEIEHKRARYQEMAASDLITFDELRSRFSELEETRRTAERELETLRGRQEHVRDLERDRDDLLRSLEEVAPEALDSLTTEERHRFYKMLRLEVLAHPDGSLEISWAGSPEMIPALGDDAEFCTVEGSSI